MKLPPRFASIKQGDCPLFKLALVLVLFNHIASVIANANHGIGFR
jgi:hypothetical protein